jgi:hypothetical protein
MSTISPATPLAISPYEARPIRFIELWQPAGWQLKVYGIAYGQPAPPAELVEAVKRHALGVLPDDGYRVGFIGAHIGRGGACYGFVDWWAGENELHHRSFLGPSGDQLRPAAADDSLGCVWDLAVIDFERRAWHELVLKRVDGPDVEAYLARLMSEMI